MRQELPVGRNLQDHITAFIGPFTVNDSVTFNLDRDLSPQAFYNFATDGTGPLTTTGPVASAFLSSSLAKAVGEGDWPDFQYMLLATAIYNKAPQDFEFAFNVRDGILRKYYATSKNKDSFMVITILGRPKGRGEVRLAGTDPTLPPIMDPKYYQDEGSHDIRVMVEVSLTFTPGGGLIQNIEKNFTNNVCTGTPESGKLSGKFDSVSKYWCTPYTGTIPRV